MNYTLTKYYVDPSDSYPLATFTIVLSLSIGFISILMIPIDVLLINKNGLMNLEKIADIVQLDDKLLETIIICKKKNFSFYFLLFFLLKLFYLFILSIGLFGFSLFLSFFLIPFSYFFGDERIEDIKPQLNDTKTKICNSLKYTVIINF